MKKYLLLFFTLLFSVTLRAQTVSSISLSPQGGIIKVGSTVNVTFTCTYSSLLARKGFWSYFKPRTSTDNCAAAGGVTVTSPTAALQPANGGSFAGGVIKWSSSYDVQNKTYFPAGAQTAIADFQACAGGVCQDSQMLAQGTSDVFNIFMTPDPGFYKNDQAGTYFTPTVVVGAVVTVGAGFTWSGQGQGNPIQFACAWSTSDPTVATVSRHGKVTAVGVGTATITCALGGNGSIDNTPTKAGQTFVLQVISPTITSPKTWYIRQNGGTPYINSSQTPSGQCDGLHDADYPGSGVNQPCALGNFRYLWSDNVTPNHLQWMISGGDTVIIRQDSAGYNIGPDVQSPTYGGTTGYHPINCGDPSCYMPSIPSGTSANHTRILGENYASCTNDAAKTLLNMTWATSAGINIKDSQYVDLACLTVRQPASCARNGNWGTDTCDPSNSSVVKGDYGDYGVVSSAMTSQTTITDFLCDGVSLECWRGATGDASVVINRARFSGAPVAGMDMDDIPNNLSNISVAGGLTMNNTITEFAGCVRMNPSSLAFPYTNCRDQNAGGYADGFGTASTVGDWYFDHDIWRYNFQDGLDLLHSGMQNVTVTNSQSYGNDGNAFKIGPATQSITFQNNIAIDNCARIAAQIGDEPITAVQYQGSPIPVLLCRAGGGSNWQYYWLGTYKIENNTFIGYSNVVTSYQCDAGSDNCSTANVTYKNNLTLGYGDNLWNGNTHPAPICALDPTHEDCDNYLNLFPPNQGLGARSNNLWNGMRKCPLGTLQAGESCNTINPLFQFQAADPVTAENQFDPFTMNAVQGTVYLAGTAAGWQPVSTSNFVHLGTPVGITYDALGYPWNNPPSLGSREYQTGAPPPTVVSIAVTPTNPTIAVNATQTFTCTATMSNSTTQPCTSPAWTSSATGVATINSSSGVATGVAAGSTTIQAAASSFTNSTTLTVSASAPTVVSIAVTPTNPTIAVNATQTFTCTATMSNSTTQPCTSPAWTSSATGVATINSSSGVATGVAAGSTTIQAAASSFTSSTTLTVTAPPPTVVSVTVTPTNPSILIGGNVSFTCTATMSNSTTQPCSSPLWTSSAPTVATITGSGVATGAAAGSTTITASASGFNNATTLTVHAAPPTEVSVTVTPTNPTVAVNGTVAFICTATMSNSTTQPCSNPAWASSATGIATISSGGVATGVAAGNSTITATDNGLSNSTTLTVSGTSAPVVSITIAPVNFTILVNQTQTYICTATLSNSTSQPCSAPAWTSSATNVATITNGGVVTGIASGTSIIGVTSGGFSASTGITVKPAPSGLLNPYED